MKRDFTYIDDIIEGVTRVLDKVPENNPNWNSEVSDPSSSKAPYKLYNIGNNSPVSLMHFIETLENCLGQTAKKEFLPMQMGDIPVTYADIEDLTNDIGFQPSISIEVGLQKFVEWYMGFYKP